MPKILILGGAGYIGSITNQELKKQHFETVIFDSLESGHDWAVDDTQVIKGDLQNKEDILSALSTVKPDAVIHFAAYIQMGESYENPGKYYRNNVVGTLNLLEALVETKINNLVFSSSAGVYGQPKTVPIPEDASKSPENPYGQTKLDVENLLHWFNLAHQLNYVALRYFNAAGANLDGSLGEAHQPESHIIPIFIDRILSDKDFVINGNDYHTPDGTCIRDYIHVLDLASAHIKAVEALLREETKIINTSYNVGTGHGYSNKKIADAIIRLTKTNHTYSYGPRRPGDADELVADVGKIKTAFGWEAKHSDLETIIKTALTWHQSRLLNLEDK